MAARDYIEAVRSRVVVFDGGMGATLEQFDLTQEDYGGLQGKCHEALVLNRPDVIEGVHESMLNAGAQVVEALRQGARPDFGMQGVTVTGGVVDASGAMDAALAIPNTQPPPPPPPPPAATPPSRPRFGKARVNRRGVVSVVVRSDPATTGVLTLSANITAARVRRVGRKAFRVGAGRRATVRVRLGRRARRQLRRRHALRLRMRAVVRNGAGLSSSRTARIRIRQPRRR